MVAYEVLNDKSELRHQIVGAVPVESFRRLGESVNRNYTIQGFSTFLILCTPFSIGHIPLTHNVASGRVQKIHGFINFA